MPMVVRENVEVTENETEIIEPTETDKEINRIFSVSNGGSAIEIQAWGSNDGDQTWEDRGSKTIQANQADTLVVGPSVLVVKLVGKTTMPGEGSTVNASLVW